MGRALLIEDSTALRSVMTEYLQARGIDAYAAHGGADARTLLPALKPEATILDLDLREGDTLSLIEPIKKAGSRCLIVAAAGEAKDRIRALSMGADDYVAKPLEMEELYLRLINLLSDVRPAAVDPTNPVLDLNGVRVELVTRTLLSVDGRPGAALTPTELTLLRVLTDNMERLVSKKILFAPISGRAYAPDTRALDVGVSRLRRKLKQSDAGVDLHSVRQAGYMMSRVELASRRADEAGRAFASESAF